MPPPARAAAFRFGEFEVDPAAEEIRKAGLRLHLPSQPFRILCLLLEQPGRLVTREELRRSLWPDGDPADYDRSLNTAVNRLRVTLCDSVENARYIQTLPRRGYRFVAAVERIGAPPACPPPTALSNESHAPFWSRGRNAAAAAGLLLFLAGVWWVGRALTTPRATSGVVALTDYAGSETTPAWSPDGRQVAFAWNGGNGTNLDIWVLKSNSRIPERLTESVGNEFSPRYSLDGRRIAFYRRAGDSVYIHVVDAGQRNLDHFAGYSLEIGPDAPWSAAGERAPAGDLASLSWSPDSKVIAYVDKTAPESPYSIFFLAVAGRRTQQVTWPPAGIPGDGAPALSPDGRYLAFVRNRSATDADIYLSTAGGGDLRRLTRDGARIRGIAWSRDGRSIVFSSERAGEPNLWRIALAGGPPERLTQVADPAVLPAMPAEADGLAFVRWSTTEQSVRADLPADGSSQVASSVVLAAGSSTPVISPDGTRIAFSKSTPGGGGEIWVSGLDGANAVRLTSGDRYSGSPKWSPDGKSIAYDNRARNNFGVYDVYVIDAIGGKPRALTSGPLQNSRPSWSADGKWIYFGSDRSGTLQIWKAPSAGGPAQQITRNGGSDAEESPDGRVLYYSRRAVGGLWSVPVNGGEEKPALEDLQWQNSRNWAVRREGIYFLTRDGSRSSERRYYLKLLRFADRRVTQIAALGPVEILNGGCSISPDARRLFYVQQQKTDTDIALVKSLR